MHFDCKAIKDACSFKLLHPQVRRSNYQRLVKKWCKQGKCIQLLCLAHLFFIHIYSFLYFQPCTAVRAKIFARYTFIFSAGWQTEWKISILRQTSHVVNLQGKARNWVIFLGVIYIHNDLVNVNIKSDSSDQGRLLNYSTVQPHKVVDTKKPGTAVKGVYLWCDFPTDPETACLNIPAFQMVLIKFSNFVPNNCELKKLWKMFAWHLTWLVAEVISSSVATCTIQNASSPNMLVSSRDKLWNCFCWRVKCHKLLGKNICSLDILFHVVSSVFVLSFGKQHRLTKTAHKSTDWSACIFLEKWDE